jgi:hypothetical protein
MKAKGRREVPEDGWRAVVEWIYFEVQSAGIQDVVLWTRSGDLQGSRWGVLYVSGLFGHNMSWYTSSIST